MAERSRQHANVVMSWRGDEVMASMKSLDGPLAKGLESAALVGADTAVRNFGSEGGGEIGKTKKGRAKYQASPPGSFPGVRTSLLRNSISWVAPKDLGRGLMSAFGTNVPYGKALEFGTSKMPARPWITRSAHLAIDRMRRVFVARVIQEMKKLQSVE